MIILALSGLSRKGKKTKGFATVSSCCLVRIMEPKATQATGSLTRKHKGIHGHGLTKIPNFNHLLLVDGLFLYSKRINIPTSANFQIKLQQKKT